MEYHSIVLPHSLYNVSLTFVSPGPLVVSHLINIAMENDDLETYLFLFLEVQSSSSPSIQSAQQRTAYEVTS